MKKLLVSGTGFPGTNKTLRYLNESSQENMEALARICGDKTILTGVEVDSGDVSDGWIAVGGELIFFQGGVVGPNVVVNTITDDVPYNTNPADSSVVTNLPAYQRKVAQCTDDPGDFPFDDLVRLDTLKNLGQAFNWLRKGTLICGEIPFGGFSVVLLLDDPLPPGTNYAVLGEFEQTGGTTDINGIAWCVSSKSEEGFAITARRTNNTAIEANFNYYLMRF